jgi:diguanylate cyclase (GGDEF)-like protein
VALGTSAWALAMELPDPLRDTLEVAALLHDVGKIGIPDHILQKPGNLTADEVAIMDQHPRLGVEILTCCCAPQELLDVIKYAGAWYDGTKRGYDLMKDKIPVGARIVAIVDAFDSMTTDHVYRRALSRDRALAELYEFAGKQFDPDLVKMFSELHERSDLDLHAKVSQRWLEALAPDLANQQWRLNVPTAQPGQAMPQPLFQQKLLDNMYDGVIFVDSQRQIFMWNQGAERLSGISGSAAYQRTWRPSLVKMRDEKGRIVPDADCPVANAVLSGVQSLRPLSIAGRGGKEAPIDLHAIPVVGRDGTTYGATLLLHDASSETSLEQRCQSLHSQATRDPLTQVANRAEFDRVHSLFIDAHTQTRLPCSLIICDIDHFKHVNDNYGHQAGDEAIKSFASLLKSMSRHGDLVARYGGEEFVLLCADCNNATAASRADLIRRALADMPQPMLGNKRITASFGVTENQPGDTPEIMLRRADRALLEAKARGRNRVMQLGSGNIEDESAKKRSWWWPFGSVIPNAILEAHLATNVPIEVAVEKLRGFVSDQSAEITSTGDDMVQLAIDGAGNSLMRRATDRVVPFIIDLKFSKAQVKNKGKQIYLTRIQVTIRPRRDRDRRREQATERARYLLSSLKSYLMAREEFPDAATDAKAKQR